MASSKKTRSAQDHAGSGADAESVKSVYRSPGIGTEGTSIYGMAQREEWLGKLPAAARASAELLYVELDALRDGSSPSVGPPARIELGKKRLKEMLR